MPWSLDICSTQHLPVHRVQTRGVSNRDTHLHPRHNISSVHLATTYVRRSGRITNGMRSGRIPHFRPRHPPTRNDPRKKSLGPALYCLRTGVERFRSCLCKWGMASSAACESGAEEQTVDRVVFQCLLIYRPPYGLHGLTVLDDETTEWLLNTCPDT